MSVDLVEAVPAQAKAETPRQWIGPVLLGHLLAVRAKPGEVLHFRAANAAAVEELAAAEHRMMLAKPDDLLRELEHVSRGRLEAPIHPGQLVVLAVRIVVALLRASQLVAVEQHGHAEREHQRGEEGAFGPLPLIEDPRVVGGPFGAAVPREIVVVAVAIVLAVGLVVLL